MRKEAGSVSTWLLVNLKERERLMLATRKRERGRIRQLMLITYRFSI